MDDIRDWVHALKLTDHNTDCALSLLQACLGERKHAHKKYCNFLAVTVLLERNADGDTLLSKSFSLLQLMTVSLSDQAREASREFEAGLLAQPK